MKTPRLQPGPMFWARRWLQALLSLWLLGVVAAFSYTMWKSGRAFSQSFRQYLSGSLVILGLVGSYALLVALCSFLAHRAALRNAYERLSIKSGSSQWLRKCWWRSRPGGPLRHGLLALRGQRLYSYRLARDRAEESSVPLRELRAVECLPPAGLRQWLFGAGRLRLFWHDGHSVDFILPGAPRSLPILERALLTAQEAA